ncbi:MAG: hypothetical protein I3273_04105 [Candidatus Moeniiplasma glomeromycotorum]|nr:hypothetical protein [Candidatus Moeniiplasma glomeromycotorum]
MNSLTLKNITIKKLTDRNLNPYYLIVNNENEEQVFFCFSQSLKEGWEILNQNWEKTTKAEITFQETRQNQTDRIFRKVVSFWTPSEEEIFV